MTWHEEMREIAARQHGLVGRRQLADLGVPTSSLASAITTGRLQRLSSRVLRLGGSADTPEQRAMAAALDVAGGAVALFSAAALWELPGFSLEPVHVLTHRLPHRGGHHLGRMHSSVRFGPDDVTTIRGIPTTTPLRTLEDLAGRIHFDRLDLICERMLARRLLRLDALHGLVASLPPRAGSPGKRALLHLASSRPEGYRPAGSSLERRFEAILERAGELPFERQVDLGDEAGWIGRVDFVDRSHLVVVEIQSDLFHSGRVDRDRDSARFSRLRRAGWTVVEITEFEVWHRPDAVLTRVRSARRRIDLAAIGGSSRPASRTE
jgi:very-short-patch-repair endonuclease